MSKNEILKSHFIIMIGIYFFIGIIKLSGANGDETVKPNVIVVPSPMTVGIDDVGWKQGWSTDVATNPNNPHHIDAPEGRWMGMPDYEAIVNIGKNVKSRLLCLFIMSEYDRTNICAEYPTTTQFGKNWDNSALVIDNDFKIMDYVKENAAYMEFGLHGVRHEYWDNGEKRTGEFAYNNFNRRPYPLNEMQNHLKCYKRLLDQYDISFPKSFVPPKHCYYHNPEDSMDTGGLMASWGIKYVSWGHKYWTRYHEFVINPMSNCQLNHGVLVLERDQAVPWNNGLGLAPDSISTDLYYECTHWHNYIAAVPEDNPEVGEKWIRWFNMIKDSPDRYLPKNTVQLNSQALYLKYANIKIDKDRIVIDNSGMPGWAYEKELLGNLVLKVALETGSHVSSAKLNNENIASYYEDRGFGYVSLPMLDNSKHVLTISVGKMEMPNFVLNDGTYNVCKFEIGEQNVNLLLDMYGTQDVKVILENFNNYEVKSNSNFLIINSSIWEESTNTLTMNITATDIQGVVGEIIIN